MMAQICSFLFLKSLEQHRTSHAQWLVKNSRPGLNNQKLNFPSQVQTIYLTGCGMIMFSGGPTKAYLDILTLAWDKEEDKA